MDGWELQGTVEDHMPLYILACVVLKFLLKYHCHLKNYLSFICWAQRVFDFN